MQDRGLFLKADISVPAAELAVTRELTGARRTLAERSAAGDDLAAASQRRPCRVSRRSRWWCFRRAV